MNAIAQLDSPERLLRNLPFAALRAFDASARLGSFRAAAEFMGLTPSAVSHQIKALEEALGAELFYRQGRTVALTEAGAQLAPHVRQGFLSFERGASALRGGARSRQIRVKSLGMFSQAVLIPNLSKFSARWPDYEVRIETTQRTVDFNQEDVDVVIRTGVDGGWPGLNSSKIMTIIGAPVAVPGYLGSHHTHVPADLVSSRLIHDSGRPQAWPRWLAELGVERPNQPGDLWFDSSPATLHAAEQGLGVALAVYPLVRSWPGYGTRLRQVVSNDGAMCSHYWMVHRSVSGNDAKIRAFSTWLRAACRALV